MVPDIAYYVYEFGSIYLLNIKERQSVLRIQGGDCPQFFPDGMSFAFSGWGGSPINAEIFKASLDGSTPIKNLTNNPLIDGTFRIANPAKAIFFDRYMEKNLVGNKDRWSISRRWKGLISF